MYFFLDVSERILDSKLMHLDELKVLIIVTSCFSYFHVYFFS